MAVTNNLTKLAQEKKANILGNAIRGMASRNVPLLSGYARKIKDLLLDPAQEMGAGKALGQYIKRQFVPKSYSQGLMERAQSLKDELGVIAGKGVPTAKEVKRIDELKELIKNTQFRAKQFENPLETIMHLGGQAFGKSGLPMKDRLAAMGQLARAGGHYGMEGVGAGFMWGTPLMAGYNVATAPEGKGWQEAGRSLGEMAGYVAAGPLGLLPSIAAGPSFGAVGEQVGEALGNVISPPSLYRRTLNKITSQDLDMAKRMIPATIRGISAAPEGMRSPLKNIGLGAYAPPMEMGAMPMNNIPPQV